MDQIIILESLEKVAAIMRRGGLHSLTRIGRHIANNLLKEDLSVNFCNMTISAPIDLRGFLYRVRAGRMEPYMSKLFIEAVRPKSVVLDIGACLGYYTLLAAQKGADVYAFEPDLGVFPYLLANINRNGFEEQVVAVSKAVADTTGAMPFFIHDDDKTQNSFFKRAGEIEEEVRVEAICLDEILDGAITVDVIKIDIEGAELHALKGMKRIVTHADNLKMFIECNPAALRLAGNSPRALLDSLTNIGLRVMAIDEHSCRLVPAVQDIDTFQKAVNFYCVRP